MKPIVFYIAILVLTCSSCHWMGYKRISGNGVITSVDRNIHFAEKIKLASSFDVEITQGPTTSVRVEADENIQPFITVSDEAGYLLIKTKENMSISSEHVIKIYITTNKLEQIQLAGSGNVIGKNKFTGSHKLSLKITGSGDIRMEVNTPEIVSDIVGSGTITLKGETKDETIHISGVGNYHANELKAENVNVKIAGSGDVKVFAETTLDINIDGVGSVYYKGTATVKQHIAGSGEVKKIE